jgi:hypothetical protein
MIEYHPSTSPDMDETIESYLNLCKQLREQAKDSEGDPNINRPTPELVTEHSSQTTENTTSSATFESRRATPSTRGFIVLISIAIAYLFAASAGTNVNELAPCTVAALQSKLSGPSGEGIAIALQTASAWVEMGPLKQTIRDLQDEHHLIKNASGTISQFVHLDAAFAVKLGKKEATCTALPLVLRIMEHMLQHAQESVQHYRHMDVLRDQTSANMEKLTGTPACRTAAHAGVFKINGAEDSKRCILERTRADDLDDIKKHLDNNENHAQLKQICHKLVRFCSDIQNILNLLGPDHAARDCQISVFLKVEEIYLLAVAQLFDDTSLAESYRAWYDGICIKGGLKDYCQLEAWVSGDIPSERS